VPIPESSGCRLDFSNICADASLMDPSSIFRMAGDSFSMASLLNRSPLFRSARTRLRMMSTDIFEAMFPPACPPIPSATMYRLMLESAR
jgi:hypothetical protein